MNRSEIAAVRGFHPREVSALVNDAVIEEHAREAALLWVQRTQAAHAAHYKLKHLARVDARVIAHLRGLEVAGEAGWRAAQAGLADLQPGTLFVATYVAFVSRDAQRMNQVLQLAVTDATFERALVAAFGWIDPRLCTAAVERLAASAATAYRRVACAAMVAHRFKAEHALTLGVQDGDTEVRALALRAIGENACRGLERAVEAGMRDPETACRFWAAISRAFRNDAAAARMAYDCGYGHPELQGTAIDVALRCGGDEWARSLVRELASRPMDREEAIAAIGAFGDPVTIPWLLEQMVDPKYAKPAGQAFALITGVDLAYEDLTLATDEDDASSDDAELSMPDPAKVREWWMLHREAFVPGIRHLAGRPLSAPVVLDVLRNGYQRQRAAAALELAILNDVAIFPVAERADWQARRLQP